MRDPFEAIGKVVDRLERAWCPGELVTDHPDLYGYISIPLDTFVPALQVALELTEGRRFLDVGCGIGTAMAVAGEMGFDCSGLEIRERYLPVAKHLNPNADIEPCDARGYDGFRAFDVIYWYRPVISDDGEAELDALICAQAKEGAVLIAPWQNLHPYGWRYARANVPHVWVR